MPRAEIRQCPFCAQEMPPGIPTCVYCGQDMDEPINYPTDNDQGWAWAPKDRTTQPGLYIRKDPGGMYGGPDDRRSALVGEILIPEDQATLSEISLLPTIHAWLRNKMNNQTYSMATQPDFDNMHHTHLRKQAQIGYGIPVDLGYATIDHGNRRVGVMTRNGNYHDSIAQHFKTKYPALSGYNFHDANQPKLKLAAGLLTPQDQVILDSIGGL